MVEVPPRSTKTLAIRKPALYIANDLETTFALFEISRRGLATSGRQNCCPAALQSGFGNEKFSAFVTSVFHRHGIRKRRQEIMVELLRTNCHRLATTRNTESACSGLPIDPICGYSRVEPPTHWVMHTRSLAGFLTQVKVVEEKRLICIWDLRRLINPTQGSTMPFRRKTD